MSEADSITSKRAPIPICFVIATITTDRAGTEGHLLRLVRALDRTRFRPLLVVLQRSQWTDSFSDPDIELIVLDFKSFTRPLSWLCIIQLAHILRLHRVKVVETHFPDAHFVGALAAKIAGVPVVIGSRRDLVSQYSKKELSLCRLSNKFTSLHLANAREVADVASNIEGISRIRVIYNGIDWDATSAGVTDQSASHVPGSRLVSIVANLTPVKNIQMFIEAVSRVANEFDDLRFAIIGCGPKDAELKSYAESLAMSDRILWTGRVNGVRPYLERSIIACLTSHSEGMSNSVLEYMAAGLPVIATRVGGIPEAVIDGVTGYLVEDNDVDGFASRLQLLLSNEELRISMAEASLHRARQFFSLEAQVRAHEELYLALVSEARMPKSIVEVAR